MFETARLWKFANLESVQTGGMYEEQEEIIPDRVGTEECTHAQTPPKYTAELTQGSCTAVLIRVSVTVWDGGCALAE